MNLSWRNNDEAMEISELHEQAGGWPDQMRMFHPLSGDGRMIDWVLHLLNAFIVHTALRFGANDAPNAIWHVLQD